MYSLDPHQLSALGQVLLEYFIAPMIGSEASNLIKRSILSKEQQRSVGEALINAEKRFVEESKDQLVQQALLSLPLATLPTAREAVGKFYVRPTDNSLRSVLLTRLSEDFPGIPAKTAEMAVEQYLRFVKEELVYISEEVRDKLQALALLNIQVNINKITYHLEDITNSILAAQERISHMGNAPPLPSLIVGREQDIAQIKTGLLAKNENITPPNNVRVLTAIRGWPGVGKTTIAAAIAHDSEIIEAFPDGILWCSLGQTPNILFELAKWGRALGTDGILRTYTPEEASTRIAAILRNKKAMLIVDDVFDFNHAKFFLLGGSQCATLVTTRASNIAREITDTPASVYRLDVLDEQDSLILLQVLAPTAVANYPSDALNLVRELEGLPLAIQVAGRLLNAESEYGTINVSSLMAELREGRKLLQARPPDNWSLLAKDAAPSVALLLQRSTDSLSMQARRCYGLLSAFAPKPATFDLSALSSMWRVEHPTEIVKELIDRGLLEQIGQRFQVHSLLINHARSLLQ